MTVEMLGVHVAHPVACGDPGVDLLSLDKSQHRDRDSGDRESAILASVLRVFWALCAP